MPTSPSAPNFGFTDYAQELQNTERRRQFAQALMQQGMEPTQTQPAVGGIVTPISPFAGLAQMAKLGVGGAMMGMAEKRSKTLSEEHNKALVDALTKLGQSPTDPATIAALTQLPETMQAGVNLSLQNAQRRSIMDMAGGQPQNPMSPNSPTPSVMAGAQGTTQPVSMPQQSLQNVPGMGGPAGGVPMKYWLAGDPNQGFQKYIEQLAKDQAPINVRPGGTVFIPGQGPRFTAPQGGMQTTWEGGSPQMGAVPGAVGAIQSTSEAGALGKSLGEFHPVQQASGATVPVLGRDIQRGGGQPSPRPTVPSGDPWANIPKLQTPTGIGQTTFQKEFQAKQAENANTLGQKFGTQADMSSQRLAYNQQALELLNTSATGPLALQSAQLKNWLVSSNLVPESAFKHPPSDTIALNKDLLNAAAEKAKQRYGSRMTQSEVMLQIKQGAPNVDMTKAAIKYLLDSDNAMAQYHIQQANDFGKYIQQQGDPMRFEGWYAKNFPMSRSVGQVQLHEPQGSSVDDLVRKWTSNK
jgi:hypothetical protein